MKRFLKKIVASAAIFLFSGCQQPPEECLPVEIELLAKIPEGSRNLTQDLRPISEKEIHAFGFFLEKQKILTVSHAVPRGSVIGGFEELMRDDKDDLLLLKTEKCGTPLVRSKKDPKKGEKVLDCNTHQERGIFEEPRITVAENAFGETALLKDLLFVSGNFSRGESGKPFCNEQKEAWGILVARNEDGGFFRSAEQIEEFLH